MTRLYLDTEFNGHGGALISLALVSPEGHEFYEAVDITTYPDYLWGDGPHRFRIEPWVAENVVPVLDKPGLHWPLFKLAFHQFIQQFDNPEVICDWNADAAHFLSLLSGVDYMSSLDFACRVIVLRTPNPGGPSSARPHNALADARGLMTWHLVRSLFQSEPLVGVWNKEKNKLEYVEASQAPEYEKKVAGL